MSGFRIVVLCIASAVAYGIVHDQITARVCIEYFTIGHPPVFLTASPTLLALGWGIIATWWCGLILGVPLALIARLGSRPKLTAADLRKPIAIQLVCMGMVAAIAGCSGYVAARAGWVELMEPLASEIPEPARVPFLADLWSHLASYGSGFLGGLLIWGWAWRERSRRRSVITSQHVLKSIRDVDQIQ
ncbi:hypothetical protein SAMN05444166_5542 [Singulisphaera sp. GP187]|uniref:hypothetical protein n=1 Tax=Singulisphaera sp. GP187 TaxID=1882752 RepID=UPI00092C1499|nr:hypothetical protein [Singulisphaera sp. GP187]SIO58002.1 hypothetical protein SAMN05444166_5542 [Singulisphaera sp. GP187]